MEPHCILQLMIERLVSYGLTLTRTSHCWNDYSAFKELAPTDSLGFAVRREIYKHLERIVDALEDVANEIDGIVIDHA